MTFAELLTEIQKLKCEEQRTQSEDYLEVVFAKDHMGVVNSALASYFGVPLKPEGSAPSGEANRRAKSYGGIRNDQTMYFRQNEAHLEYAFLWPWGSGTRVTVKIIQAKGSGSKGSGKGFLARLFGR